MVRLSLVMSCALASTAHADTPLALTDDDRLVAIGDASTGELVLVDSVTLDERARVHVGARPATVLALASGEVAVACRDDDWVAIVDPLAERVTRIHPTGVEPRALAVHDDRLYVATGDARVTSIDLTSGATLWQREVGQNPSTLALGNHGRTLWVGHLDGAPIHELATHEGATIRSHALFPDTTSSAFVSLADGRVLATAFTLVRSPLWSKAADFEGGSYGGSESVSLVPELAVLQPVDEPDWRLLARTHGPAQPRYEHVPTIARSVLDLPRVSGAEREVRRYVRREGSLEVSQPASLTAAARHPDGRAFFVDTARGKLWVVGDVREPPARAAGNDGLVLTTKLGELPEPLKFPHFASAEVSTFELGVAPTGIAFDRSGARVYVAFGLAGGLAVADTAAVTCVDCMRTPGALDPRVWTSVRIGPELEREVAVGRRLFHTVDARTSDRGLTCTSCHPDGMSDGRVWRQSFGPRQTPILAGRVTRTEPYGWVGQQPTLAAHIRDTVRHRLGGSGLGRDELAALTRFVTELAPPRGVISSEGVARGRALFDSPTVGCSGCHAGERLTDSQRYDVGTTNDDERERARRRESFRRHERPEQVPIAFDVPSLIGVARSAPYLHDGSAATLRDVVTTRNPHDTMGRTSHLSASDVDALVAYLRTL